jgi:serine/threonine protein kinase
MRDDQPTQMSDTSMRLRAAFDALIELPAAQRQAWLDANMSDPGEQAAVLRLVAADDRGGFLDTPAIQHAARLAAQEIRSDGLIGQQIGSFRVLRALGQGGMAAVFLGERVGADFHQQVAIKLLRRGLYSELEQRLFLRERQVLAGLNHPNIARLIDGGVTDAGIPYLVLEFVDGAPITHYVQAHALDLRGRLEIFLTVCRAVSAAHRSLIVHRDIKPSNILVSNDGAVKLLDFGIAKLIEEEGTADATHTIGVFTPDYAAPEQVAGQAITTATDVYGLGVLLHELLLGVRPEGTPTRRPSSLVNTRGGDASTNTDGAVYPFAATRLRKQLRGDLDNILLKALDPEPAQRYATANSFGDDIERYLRRQPVLAHPPSRLYRARKFVQRHRGGVTLTIVFILGILSALGLALWQSGVAREQARLARNQAQRANATRDFMVDLFETASADLPRDQRPTPEQLVSEAAKRTREDVGMDASLRAQLLDTLGKVALSNGNYAQAESLLDEAIQRERALGMSPSTSPELLGTLVQKGNLLHRTDRSSEADRLMASVLPELRAGDSEAAVSGLMLYAATRAYAGHADDAVAIAQQVSAKAQRVFGADSINAIETQTYLGQLCSTVRRYREAEPMLEQAIARWRALKLPEDEQLARSLFHLAAAKAQLGERSAVEPLYREGIALMRRVFDGPHDRIASGLVGLGNFLITQDRFDDAQIALEEALAIDRKVLGPDNSKTAIALDNLAQLDIARHHTVAAEQSARAALAAFVAQHESSYQEELELTRLHLAEILIELDRLDEAATLHAQAIQRLPTLFGANSKQVAGAIRIGGDIALARDDATAALGAADRALAMLEPLDPKSPQVEIASRYLRMRALDALGRRDEALAEATRALNLLHETNPDAHAQQTAVLAARARIERAQGKTEVAAATVAQARVLAMPASVLSAQDVATLQVSAQ